MMNREEDIRKELEEISPFLSRLKKENPFEVPADYFENLPDQILEQVRPTAQPSTPVARESWLDQLLNSLATLLQPRPALALVSLALLVVAGIFLLRTNDPGQLAERTLAEEAKDYIASNIDEVDDELLMEMVFGGEEQAEDILPDVLGEDELLIDEVLDELEDVNIEDLL